MLMGPKRRVSSLFFVPRSPFRSLPFALLLLLALLLVSCALVDRNNQADTGKTEKDASGRDRVYHPGDVRLEAGVEYIYVKNRKFGSTPYEPECVWIRKDEYSPRLFEQLENSILSRSDKKETEELEKRIAKLEAEVRGGGGLSGSPAPKTASAPAPGPAGFSSAAPLSAAAERKPKRRVLVLPMRDETGPGEGHFNHLATTRLVSALEYTGAVICVDPRDVGATKNPLTGENLEALDMQGVQVVIRVDLSAPDSAFLEVSLDIYGTETAKPFRRLSARTSVEPNMPERDLIKAVDHTINLIKEDLSGAIRSLDWHARVASVEKGRTLLNTGRLSGMREGDILEVYGQGGRLKGAYKGEIEVLEMFGADASWARTLKGGPFSPADLVYLKK